MKYKLNNIINEKEIYTEIELSWKSNHYKYKKYNNNTNTNNI